MTETTNAADAATAQPTMPPGPSSKLMTTLRIVRDHYKFYEDLYARYEDPVRVPSMNGDVAVTRDPERIRQIFSGSPELFDPFAVDAMRGIVGPGSLLLLGGAAHRAERKLLMPPFHGDRMRAYGEVMRDVALAQLHALQVGAPFIAQRMTTDTSLEVIIRAVFGVMDPARVAQVRAAIDALIEAMHPSLMFFKGMQRDLLGLSPWPRFQRKLAVVDALLRDEIRARRVEGATLGEDILSMMALARYEEDGALMEEDALRDELLTLLIAGHETTGVALAWAMYHLHRDPVTLATLREELLEAKARGDAPHAIARLPYLSAVCQETLRLYPIVPDVLRTLRAPMQLGPHLIPAGKLVGVAIVAVHHDPALYPDPMRFRPERFIERKYKPWEYMPFGGGHRRCIGAAFASFELAMALAAWITHGTFELLDGEVKAKRRNVTLGPATGVRMRLVARHD